MQIDELH